LLNTKYLINKCACFLAIIFDLICGIMITSLPIRIHTMLIFLLVLGIAALLYLFEVVLGSSSSVYNCELGAASSLPDKTRVSRREYFGRILPLLLAVLGVPLLFTRLPLGAGFLLLAVILAAGSAIGASCKITH
jgi:hypothetical protein